MVIGKNIGLRRWIDLQVDGISWEGEKEGKEEVEAVGRKRSRRVK